MGSLRDAITQASNAAGSDTPEHDRAWVDALYLALLGRPPDQTGEDYWTNQLQGLQTPLQVANGFTGWDRTNAIAGMSKPIAIAADKVQTTVPARLEDMMHLLRDKETLNKESRKEGKGRPGERPP
jgi:hypothetical protein